MTANRDPKAVGLILVGLLLLWGFGWDTIGRRLRIDVEGVIVATRDVPSTGAPRYATEYTVRGADGREQVLWAGPTDGSLPRSMPVGTRIHKQRWRLDYERDGKRVAFPYIFYDLALGIALCVLLRGILLLRPWRT